MAIKWISCGKGIRYREHPTRKHGKISKGETEKPADRYYVLQYKRNGKVINESMGRAS